MIENYTFSILLIQSPNNLNLSLLFISLLIMTSTTIKVDIKVRDTLVKYKKEFGSKTLSDTIQILILKYEKLKVKS